MSMFNTRGTQNLLDKSFSFAIFILKREPTVNTVKSLVNMKLITIKEICTKFGITPYTINHYTNLRLLRVVAKIKNRRLYDVAEVEYRLKQIQELINQGYSLQLISKKLNSGI